MTKLEAIVERFDKLVAKSLRRAIRAGTSELGSVSVRAAGDPMANTGAMLALVPSDADLDRLSLPDGEPRDQLHLTLHFLGPADEIPPDFIIALQQRLETWVPLLQAVEGVAWNVGYFNPLGEDPCVALGIGGPAIDLVHGIACDAIEASGVDEWEPPDQHCPWVPHLTLTYDPVIPDDIDAAVERLGPITFTAIRLAIGMDVYDYPLGETAVTAAAQQPAEPYISLDDLAAIETAWRVELARELLPALGRIYIRGAEETLAEIAAEVGANPITLASHAAEVYLAEAERRLTRVGAEVWRAIRQELVTGMQLGEDVDQLAKRVRSELVSSSVRAQTIARTEVISASNAGAISQVRAMGDATPAQKVWIATSDGRTRPSHRAADGQVVGTEDSFEVGGASLDYPGDPNGPADEVVNCRCSVGWEFGDKVITDEALMEVAASAVAHRTESS